MLSQPCACPPNPASRHPPPQTPDDGAIKWWIGNAAEDGRMATVFARLKVGTGGGVGGHGWGRAVGGALQQVPAAPGAADASAAKPCLRAHPRPPRRCRAPTAAARWTTTAWWVGGVGWGGVPPCGLPHARTAQGHTCV